jgi:ribosome-associated protein
MSWRQEWSNQGASRKPIPPPEVAASGHTEPEEGGTTMVGDLRVDATVTIPAAELQWRFSHAGGPGGQGVNTADSKVELRFNLAATNTIPPELKQRALHRLGSRLVEGSLIVTASAHRTQLDNRRAAAAKLAVMLSRAIAEPVPTRRATRPTRASVEARLDTKRRRGRRKAERRDTDD